MKKWISLAITVAALMTYAAPGAPYAVGPAEAAEDCPSVPHPVGSLSVGRALFWDGEYVDTETGEGACTYEYELQVGDGDRLRVALNVFHDYRADRKNNEGVHPDAASGRDFELQVLDANGNGISRTTDESGYSTEVFLCFNRSPGDRCLPREFAATKFKFEDDHGEALERSSPGPWTIRVSQAGDVLGWKFRLRAKLEKAPTAEATAPLTQPQLPNLKAIPPFELTFCEPVVAFGFAAGREPFCGPASDGLTPQEQADAGADRGLRFSAGPENTGEGALDLRQHRDDPRNTPDSRIAYQRLYSPDADGDTYAEPAECSSNSFDCEAGKLEFHQDHGHWHYEGFFLYELFLVADPSLPLNKRRLTSSTPGSKVGFCPSDDGLADWGRFFQERRYRWELDRFDREGEPLPQCLSMNNPMMGLSSGWGDFYEWQRVEQFVPFPVTDSSSNLESAHPKPAPGFYLLRATVDPAGQIRESNEKDNASFAYFEVPADGGPIRIIERDYGTDP